MMKKAAAMVMALLGLVTLVWQIEGQQKAQPVSTEETVTLPIVMYHHMSAKPDLWCNYVLSVEEFKSDLAWLKKAGYESITIEDLLAWYDGKGSLPEKPVMITFDDGFLSTTTYAVPLMEAYGFQGVLAVIGSVSQQYTDHPDRNLDYAYIDWDGIRALAQDDVLEIQCHTWDMHQLEFRMGCSPRKGETLDAYKQALGNDLCTFLQRCNDEQVTVCNAIAFPYGLYTKDTVAIVKQMGFRVGFTCEEHVNYLTGDPDECLTLGRYHRMHGVDSETFFAKWEEGNP